MSHLRITSDDMNEVKYNVHLFASTNFVKPFLIKNCSNQVFRLSFLKEFKSYKSILHNMIRNEKFP